MLAVAATIEATAATVPITVVIMNRRNSVLSLDTGVSTSW